MKIVVYHPINFIKERQYTLEVLFAYFKNIDLVIIPENRENYKIQVLNFQFTIEDHFWQSLPEEEIDSLWTRTPKKPKEFNYKEGNYSFTSIYGEADIINDSEICLRSDIIGAAFFFLTRWEEWRSEIRDKHDRFPDSENFQIKHGLHKKALVNEYIDFIKEFIELNTNHKLEYSVNYKAYVTHDVDELFRFKPFNKWVKSVASEVILRKNVIGAFKMFFKGLFSNLGLRQDDSQTFDFLMDVSERNNLTSYFYFIPGEPKEKYFRYSISSIPSKNLIKKISTRNHIVGIHPSYRSKDNENYFIEELNRLKNLCPETITEGRHHYLRMNFPDTMEFWENSQLKTDSSLGFIDHAGFRAAMCYEYPIYNLKDRKKMNLTQRPLISMEVALNRNKVTYDHFKNEIKELVKTTKKHHGNFVFLWHNNNINHPAWSKLGEHYEEIIEIIASKE